MPGVCVRQRQQIRVAFFTVQCTVYIERKVTIGRVVSVSSTDFITRLHSSQLNLTFLHSNFLKLLGKRSFFVFVDEILIK